MIGSSSNVSIHDPLEHRTHLVEYIISTNQSFSHVEDEGFIKYVSYLVPGIQIISRSTLRRDVLKYFLEEKEKMKAILSSGTFSVALTSDIWTGKSRMDFMSVVVHNIDEQWNLNKRIIAFRRIEGKHTANNILEIILGVIQEWELSARIISVTLDNATSNDSMIRGLQTKILCEENLMHQRCATHIINLIVQSGARAFHSGIKRIRHAISWINSSTPRVDELKRRFLLHGLHERTFHVDNKIRWNSTYLMLTNFLSEGYYEVIVAFYNSSLSEGEGALSEEDINMAKVFVTFLKLFYDQTCCLSVVYKPTSHLAIHSLCAIAQHFKTNMDYVIFQDCISSMRDKFLKYWGKGKIPYLYEYACILDPRIQMDGLKMFLNFLQDMFIGEDYITHDHNRIVEGFYDLFRVYQERVAPPPKPSSPRNARQEEEYMFLSVHRHFRGVDGSPQSSPRGRGGRGSPQPSQPIYDEISRYTTHLHV